MKRLLLAAVLVVLLACGYVFRDALFGTANETRSARPAPAQLVVADIATQSPAPILVSAIGTVQSIATVMIKSRMDGEIAQVNFEEGQEVNEGDVLFTLDERGVRAQLQQAEANLERDRAQLERFKLEVTRQTELAHRGVASPQKLEDTTTSVAVTEATVRASEAAVENARVNLAYTTIRAPITGRTGAISLKRGNVVKAMDTAPTVVPLVTITQLRPIYVSLTVPERYLADLRAAMAAGPVPVAVTMRGQENAPITGTLTFIDNQVDVTTGTISLKAKFSNDDERLWPGQFVNVTLTLGIQENAVVVPSVAIQVGPNGPYVFMIRQDSTVELRLVKPDRTVGDKTVIAEGIAAGERVVVDGQLRLGNGTRVTVQGSTPPKPQPSPVAERTP
ncbi:MAG TPA: efflux RND transporter periplasmic adaptor subunit [Xanthobacteraceae bacterium]|nr:efflux RND transporter periplasmic adaptor subunit [Xanthobacteraceae bacterium]